MKRQQRTPGAIVEISIDDAYYCYGQIMVRSGVAFFDLRSEARITDLTVLLTRPVLFTLAVYNDIITRGEWLKVGKLPIREDLRVWPMQFIQDSVYPDRFELYDPNTGSITRATKEQCRGLERCAVWDKDHVESRLSDHYAGRPNIYVMSSLNRFNASE